MAEDEFSAATLATTLDALDLSGSYSTTEIISAGYTVSELVDVSFNASDLVETFFEPNLSGTLTDAEVIEAGFSAADLKDIYSHRNCKCRLFIFWVGRCQFQYWIIRWSPI